MSERIGKISTSVSVGTGAEIEDYLRTLAAVCNLKIECNIKVGWFLEKGNFTVRGKESDLYKFRKAFLVKVEETNQKIENGTAYR